MDALRLATPTHQKAYDLVYDLLHKDERVLALSLAGSAARNKGAYDSDLDFDIFFDEHAPAEEIIERVDAALHHEVHAHQGQEVGRFFAVDLHAAATTITPQRRGWTDGPDAFELEIGNIFVYSRLAFEREGYFTQAKARYLPYYEETLRQERLRQTLKFCHNNIDHIAPYVKRGLYFQAFRRLNDASLEFLQALFIAKQVYPIAYDKWVQEQLVEILNLPDLYRQFVALYQVQALESDELIGKGEQLRQHITDYVADERS